MKRPWDKVGVKLVIAAGAALLLVGLAVLIGRREQERRRGTSAEAILARADEMAWLNSWIQARPLYAQAESLFEKQNQPDKALYSRVSQIPAVSEWASIPEQIAALTADLSLPGAKDAETRLRILTIRGMLETNYDAGLSRATWVQVQELAEERHHYLLAVRAVGEQGIAAFLLGDLKTAKKKVLTAWGVAKYLNDPAARVRYASVYGAGLNELRQYNKALKALDEAIKVATTTPGVAYPTIAIFAKVDALTGLGRYSEALAITDQATAWATKNNLSAHLFEIHRLRGDVYLQKGSRPQAIQEYSQALSLAKSVSYWRGLTQAGGSLALSYEGEGNLAQAVAINQALEANRKIPDELYFAPRNLAIKADILAQMGQLDSSNGFYEKSADLIDAMLAHAPTPGVERDLIAQLSQVYSGYFHSLCNQHRYAPALRAIEKARGRLEAQALEHHQAVEPHKATPEEERLTRLNVELIDTDDGAKRASILEKIGDTEQALDESRLADEAAERPVSLSELQQDLAPTELVIEYMLDEPHSYALAITNDSVSAHSLPGRGELESKASQYRDLLRNQKTDPNLARQLFDGLLGGIPEYKSKRSILIVPDGKLSLIPFAALMDGGEYVVTSHVVSSIPSSTVLHLIRSRKKGAAEASIPLVGVAAWTGKNETLLKRILRSVEGPKRSEFDTLPESRREVESVAADLPKPSTILLGSSATETRFKQLPLNQYNVLHLALHGYADLDYPDRSALAFAPEMNGADDGLLQVREIRHLGLNASLVTLSACNTGVGPVGQTGVANIANAFIEAGAQSVIATLWELEDRATIQLMSNFYTHLAHGMKKGEALRQAQLDLLYSGQPPFYWASFEIVGEPDDALVHLNDLGSANNQPKGPEWSASQKR